MTLILAPHPPLIGLAVLTVLAFVLITLLIAVVETVVLQWVRWGNLRQSLKGSLAMNAVSGLVLAGMLVIWRRPAVGHLFIGYGACVVIEGLVLRRLQTGPSGLTWLAVALANLVSYLVLIVPSFMFR